MNLLNLFASLYFGLFQDLRGIISVQTQSSESGSGKSDRRKYSCLQGRFSTVTIGSDFPEPNEALPSRRNNHPKVAKSTDTTLQTDNASGITGYNRGKGKVNGINACQIRK
jgi:hypothetical protein